MSSPSVALRGNVSPRVRLAPGAADSEGHDACELAAAYGLRAFDWQRAALVDLMGVRPDGRWAATRAGLSVPRQNGKNGAAEIYELFVTSQLGMRVLHSAHEVKTARKAFKRLLDFYDNPRLYPELAGLVKEVRRTNGQEAVELHNGGGVEFVARTKSSGRGYSADVLLLDEAQELTDDQLEAMQPTISASQNPQTILLGTPPKRTKPAPVWRRFRAAGVAGVDPRLCWIEYSAADGDDLDDERTWLQGNPGAPVSISLDTILDERAAMSDDGFAAERCGIWFDQDTGHDAAFDVAQWGALADPSAERGTSVAFGLATAADRTWSAIAVAWRRPDGHAQVMLADYHAGTAWVAARAIDLRERWGGAFTADTPSRGLVADAEEPGQAEQATAHNALWDSVQAGTVRHGNEPALNVAVSGARWRPLGDTRVLDRRGSTDIAPVIAAALALHGLSTSKPSSTGWMVSL